MLRATACQSKRVHHSSMLSQKEISRPFKILLWLKETPRRVISDEHTLALRVHNSVVAGATPCHGWSEDKLVSQLGTHVTNTLRQPITQKS